MPDLPDFEDTPTTHKFYSNLIGLVTSPFWSPVPHNKDGHMFITVGLGLETCGPGDASCRGPLGQRLAATLDNEFSQFPTRMSILQEFFENVSGVFTTDFPNQPPLVFYYTNTSSSIDPSLMMTTKSTKVKKLMYNSSLEIVMQALLVFYDHLIHLYGFNFYVLAKVFDDSAPLRLRKSSILLIHKSVTR